MPLQSIRSLTHLFGALGLLCALPSLAQSNESLAARIDQIMSRPEFAHADFGIEFYALDTHRVIYSLNANKLFVPASTTKLLTEGTVLARLGANFRFHTKVFRTGPVDSSGRLKGDLVLVAAGDPNLSNRIQPDGTLAFMDDDHSEGGPLLAGDPLAVIKELVEAVRAKGIRRIDGRVLVDTSLFPDGQREGGSGTVLSSIIVNDNLIDVVATPGAGQADPVMLRTVPQTAYARFISRLTTSAPGTKPNVDDPVVESNPDGTATITLSGSLPAGTAPLVLPVPVPSPTRFATTVLLESLRGAGVRIAPARSNVRSDPGALAHFYTQENLVAEHVSPLLSEDLKVTLKVSQNLHAGIGQYLLGAYVGHDAKDTFQTGFQIEHAFLEAAQLDLSGASQGDGPGGDWADLFSPEFICSYLTYWSGRPDFDALLRALPVMGRDGTLAPIQTQSPAAGHVFAKTGTLYFSDRLNNRAMLNGKGLAGYVWTRSGRKLAFAAYVNHVAIADSDGAQAAGQALGAIAAAAYDAPL
jgi:PBP4 family serine-type D-alanyl-D-alanine carboxypeptidase